MKVLFKDPNDDALVVAKVTYASYQEDLSYDNMGAIHGFYIELVGGAEIGIPYMPKEFCDQLTKELFADGVLDITHQNVKWLE